MQRGAGTQGRRNLSSLRPVVLVGILVAVILLAAPRVPPSGLRHGQAGADEPGDQVAASGLLADIAADLGAAAATAQWSAADLEAVLALAQAPAAASTLPAADLRESLMAWSMARGQAPEDLDQQIANLRLAPATADAIASLLAAFRQAETLQAQAMSAMTNDEVALLTLQPDAVESWFTSHPEAGQDGFEAELAALASKVDLSKNLEAATLLARAVEQARPFLAQPPEGAPSESPVPALPEDPWIALQILLRTTFLDEASAPRLPELALPEALRLLAVAAGHPDPGPVAPDVPLPPGLANALANIVTAQAFALSSQDPFLGGLALLEASRTAEPVLRALAEARSPLPGLPLPSDAWDRSQPDELPAASALPPTGTGLDALLADQDGDGAPDEIERLAGTDPEDGGSRPVGGSVPDPIDPRTDGPLVVIGRPLAGADEPTLLIVGDVADETVDRESLVHIDLGGDDTYRVPVGTSTNFLLELGGDDRYDTPNLSGTQGSAQGLGAAILLDLAGNDLYRAKEASQGSSCCGAAAALPDLEGAAEAVASTLPEALYGLHENGTAAARQLVGGLGVLADFSGDDSYDAGIGSQGYGSSLVVSGAHHASAPEDEVRGFAGILFDAAGTDLYRFATQGFARTETLAFEALKASDCGHPVGLFVDALGDDLYENLAAKDVDLLPVDDQHIAGFFGTQGNAKSPASDCLPPRAPTGVFLDLGGADEYRLPTLASTVVDASAQKNNNQRLPEPANLASVTTAPSPRATVGGPLRLFTDIEPSQVQEAITDRDGDNASLLVELLAGTDPEDGEDNPGSLFGSDSPYMVRVPHLLGRPPAGDPILLLPGLAIAGAGGNNIHSETFDFFIDLGGDDAYLAPGHGGAVVPDPRAVPGRLPAVRLAVDVAGNDTYAPAAAVAKGPRSPSGNPIAYASTPTLGAGHLGVGVLVDLGGNNSFTSNVTAHAEQALAQGGSSQPVLAGAWGASQGAGLFGGVGILVTHNATNRFDARAYAQADDNDTKPERSATAYGASQGVGFLGIGILGNLGDLDDEYRVQAVAKAPFNEGVWREEAAGVGQGAGFGGIGILVDAGGRNQFRADDGFAQGIGWAWGDRHGMVPHDEDLDTPAFTVEGGTPVSNYKLDPGHGIGVLVGGLGTDKYVAAGPAQGTGGAFHEIRQRTDTRYAGSEFMQVDVLEGGSGMGLLLDRGGADSYLLTKPSAGSQKAFPDANALLGQAAALPDSLGLLLDQAGNDRYESGPGQWSQAASLGGAALLMDLDGQDTYIAYDQAQGFAQAALLAAVRESVCTFSVAVPCDLLVVGVGDTQKRPYFGNQYVIDALPQGATLAILLDAGGLDRFVAGQQAQGFATDKPDPTLQGAFCRDPSDPGNMANSAGQKLNRGEVAGCAPSARMIGPQDGVVLPGSPNRPMRDAKPLGPNGRGPLLGVLIDADGTDSYDYADDLDGDATFKVPLDEAPGPNDWKWLQQDLAVRDLNQTGLPENPLLAPPRDVPEPASGVVWNASRQYPSGAPSQALCFTPSAVPGLPQSICPSAPAFGGGIDADTLAAALQSLAEAGVEPVQATLELSWDPAGEDPVGDATIVGRVYVHVDVNTSAGTGPVAAVDLVTQDGLLGRAQPVANQSGAYVFAWDTSRPGDTPQKPSTPDGAHRLQAAVQVEAAPGAPGRTIGSRPVLVQVDNAPLVALQVSPGELSATAPGTTPASIRVDIGLDQGFPAGQPPSGDPGGYLTVSLEPIAPTSGDARVLLPTEYHPAGARVLAFDGRCGPDPCPDGEYQVRARLEDAGGRFGEASASLRLDSKAPFSQVQLPRNAGTTFQSGTSGLRIPWTLHDHGATVEGLTANLLLVDGAMGPATLLKSNLTVGGADVVYQGVLSGETLRFITVAQDRVGNLESPCLPGEASPCYRALAMAHPERLVLTTVDFSPPQILSVSASADFIRPGAPVTFAANVQEEGSGLAVVHAEMTCEALPGFSQPCDPVPHELTPSGVPGQFVYADWGSVTGAFNASANATERVVTVQVTVTDNATNFDDGATVAVLLDGLPPRLDAKPPEYYEAAVAAAAQRIAVGRPGAFALVRLAVDDASLADDLPGIEVRLDPRPLDPAAKVLNLSFDGSDETWQAFVAIPGDATDGIHALPVRVVDAAGNVAEATVEVAVHAAATAVGPLRALEVRHDGVVVGWSSAEPATRQVRYGRTAIDMNRFTPADVELGDQHVVEVSGLAPNTDYFFQGLSRGRNGVERETGVLAVRTSSAIAINLAGVQQGATYGGLMSVRIEPVLRTGEDADVALALAFQPANASLQPIPLLDLPAGRGPRDVVLDLRGLPDGPAHLLVKAFRPGDLATLLSPEFRIDNAAPFLIPFAPSPGAYVPSARPGIVVGLGDPGGNLSWDWATGAILFVDGNQVPVAGFPGPAEEAALGVNRSLLLVPLADLPDGPHLLRVLAKDAAGNNGTVTWPIVIDTKPPSLLEAAAVGPEGEGQAAPGTHITVKAILEDSSGIARATADLAALGLGNVSLVERSGIWSAGLALPMGLGDGELRFNVTMTDRAGNRAFVPEAVRLLVDSVPPALAHAAVQPGFVRAHIDLAASEPVRFEASLSRAGAEAGNASSTRAQLAHSFEVTGLVPGADHVLRVQLVDRAGNTVEAELPMRALDDTVPPSAPSLLAATSVEEGIVLLSWAPATDNAGIARYEASLDHGATWSMAANGTASTATIEAAPGREATIELRAVDVAGLQGPPAVATVDVLALPHLSGLRVDRDVVDAGRKVLVEVEYRHAAGVVGTVILSIGDVRLPMERGDGDCRTGCTFRAKLSLEASDLFGAARTLTATADDGQHTATSEPIRAPLVVAGDDAGLAIPSPGPALGLLLAALALGRRRRAA